MDIEVPLLSSVVLLWELEVWEELVLMEGTREGLHGNRDEGLPWSLVAALNQEALALFQVVLSLPGTCLRCYCELYWHECVHVAFGDSCYRPTVMP